MAAGVAVMGHCGLLPQSISVLGGFRPQGQSAAEALRVVHEARVRLQLPEEYKHPSYRFSRRWEACTLMYLLHAFAI